MNQSFEKIDRAVSFCIRPIIVSKYCFALMNSTWKLKNLISFEIVIFSKISHINVHF
jgi:hypothetical protein